MVADAHLYVFEGPDGVGKSSLAKHLHARLQAAGERALLWSFPGREAGTLGFHIYDLHHEPERLGVHGMTETARQLLHITAHIDAIERRLLPALSSGISVVLDRYWWSTWVYGVIGGADRQVLDAMIDVERRIWGSTTPARVFLVRRTAPFALRPGETLDRWLKLRATYDELAAKENKAGCVSVIDNDGPFQAACERVVAEVADLRSV